MCKHGVNTDDVHVARVCSLIIIGWICPRSDQAIGSFEHLMNIWFFFLPCGSYQLHVFPGAISLWCVCVCVRFVAEDRFIRTDQIQTTRFSTTAVHRQPKRLKAEKPEKGRFCISGKVPWRMLSVVPVENNTTKCVKHAKRQRYVFSETPNLLRGARTGFLS